MDNEIINLVPGKLYVAHFEVIDGGELERLQFQDDFYRAEKQELEALLKKELKEKGHECDFVEFKMESTEVEHTFDPPMSVTGSLDLGKSTFFPYTFPKKIIKVYFRVRSITAVVLISILIAVLTTSILLVAPEFVSIMEAAGDIINSGKDVVMAVIAEPRKLAGLGIAAFIPVIALIAAISFFVLKPRGAI